MRTTSARKTDEIEQPPQLELSKVPQLVLDAVMELKEGGGVASLLHLRPS